ncbi:MAG: AMP-binding protein [Ardenticatenaceae bacterium]
MVSYEEMYGNFSWEFPEKFNFAGDVVDRWAEQEPELKALFWVDDDGNEKSRTYAQMSLISQKLCNFLTGLGVERGDVLIIMLGREIEWWEICTASLRMGAILSPGTTQMTAKDIEYRINRAEATCFISTEAHAAKLEAVAEQCPTLKARVIIGAERDGWANYEAGLAAAADEFETADTAGDEDAICYFTSGTTGYPKMALHTHTSYPLGHITTGTYWLNLKPGDLHWNISDTGWAKAAWSSYFGPWNCGATVFVHQTKAFNAAKTLSLLQRYPIQTLCGPPTVYRMLVLQDLSQYRFPHLGHCISAGEPLNPEVIQTWHKATDIIIRDGYGQTETVILCGSFLNIEPRYGSMGKPAPGIDLQVVDNEGQIAPPNQEGDIAVRVHPNRPLGLFKEYWKDPERTAATRKGDWYITGDRAYVDEDGYFWFVGRADDVILSAGYRIGPFEVESALIEHPAVAESAVVASPDEVRGAVVKAFVILTPGYKGHDPSTSSGHRALVKELQDHVKAVTAPYKYPRKIEFVDALPKTISGKIRRVELRAREQNK